MENLKQCTSSGKITGTILSMQTLSRKFWNDATVMQNSDYIIYSCLFTFELDKYLPFLTF